MTFLLIILLSSVFTVLFITFHLLFLYFFSFKKTIQILFLFALSNLILIYFAKEFEIHKLFYNSFIINFAILITYFNFLLVIKRGFTLSILASFKKKEKLPYKELVKSYANGKGAKWVLMDRLKIIDKLKIIRLDKKIILTPLGCFLSIILIFLRKILVVRDFG